MLRFAQVFVVQPWSKLFLSTAIDHLIKDASGGGRTSEREPGPVPCEDMIREDGRTISLHSFILFPMPPSANRGLPGIVPLKPPWNWWWSHIEPASAILLHSFSPGLSMGHFGTAWATCTISKCCHYKMAGLNLSTHLETDWASACHPFGLKLPGKLGIQPNHQFHIGLVGWS